jgi:hypothetical protein
MSRPFSADYHPGVDWYFEDDGIFCPAAATPEQVEGFLADPASLPSAAIWAAATINSSASGSNLDEKRKTRVLSLLTSWRTRYGPLKFAELRQQALATLDNPRLIPQKRERFRQQIEQAFERIGA